MSNNRLRGYSLLSVLALVLLNTTARGAASTYQSLQDLPDFSGAWSLARGDRQAAPPPPLRPEIAGVLAEWRAKTAKGTDPADFDGSRHSYCGPARFAGFNGGVQDYVEFLFTPSRVTITNELGLIRRIPLDRPKQASPPEASTSGTSNGHWEGRTLVVETTALDPETGYGEPLFKLPVKIGRDVRIVEHISLQGPDVLQIVTQMSAPDLFSRPYEATTFYERDRQHELRTLSNCLAKDRAFDERTGRERMDLTPPANLPPPPAGSKP